MDNQELANGVQAGSTPAERDPKQCDPGEVFAALEKWIGQRSKLDWRDYGGDGSAYRSEARSIAADGKRARAALREARHLTPAQPDILMDSFRAFSGRLEWIPGFRHDLVWQAENHADNGHLEYCTGQYFPTEYRKAAAAVLETYVAAWLRWNNDQNPKRFVYRTISDVKAANREVGEHWFERSTMRFFNTRIVSKLISGRYFVTAERMDDTRRFKYTVRSAEPDGSIDTVGEFQQYDSKEDAMIAVRSAQ